MIKKKRFLFIIFIILIIFIYFNSSRSSKTTETREPGKIFFRKNPVLSLMMNGKKLPPPAFTLQCPGTNEPIDYTAFGEFKNLNTSDYQYVIKDEEGLRQSIGAGIYPNQQGILNDRIYRYFNESHLIDEFHWDILTFNDWQKAFYIWTQAPEEEGVKSFFTSQCLENAGLIMQAIKAYHATIVHFPKSVCWSQDQSFVWYVAQAAIENIHRLCREYPDLNIKLVDDHFHIQHGEDTDTSNDLFEINPGHFVKTSTKNEQDSMPDLNKLKITAQRGTGKVKLSKYENGHWLLTVNNNPFYIQGITYQPTRVGLGPKQNPLFSSEWMFNDLNQNGRIDAPYDSWIDKNKNGRKEETDPVIGDFQLMKDMGVNAIRLYVEPDDSSQYNPKLLNKELLRDMYETYGISVIVGDFLGAYTRGSGASWEDGTDYKKMSQRERMKQLVHDKVMDLKDEPFVLMWILGNENTMPIDYVEENDTRTNASQHPVAYAEFLNEVAQMIHEIDKNHPVAIGNLELDMLDIYEKYAPEIDIIGINSYRSSVGFGDLWEKAQNTIDRPVLITEFGCDAYAQGLGEDEEAQVQYHQGKWKDIILNEAGGPLTGISLGGIIFEFLDEWWKDTSGNSERSHQIEAQRIFGSPDGFSHEEWYGIIGQGNGAKSPFQREPRKAYEYYQTLHKSAQ